MLHSNIILHIIFLGYQCTCLFILSSPLLQLREVRSFYSPLGSLNRLGCHLDQDFQVSRVLWLSFLLLPTASFRSAPHPCQQFDGNHLLLVSVSLDRLLRHYSNVPLACFFTFGTTAIQRQVQRDLPQYWRFRWFLVRLFVRSLVQSTLPSLC